MQYPGSRFTTAGEAWRAGAQPLVVLFGGALLLIVLVAIGIYYFTKGPLGDSDQLRSGRAASSASRRSSARRTGSTPSRS